MAFLKFRSLSTEGIAPLASRCFLVAVTVFFVTHAPVVLAQNSSTPRIQDFDWTTITPSAQLQWTDCYSNFKCARFSVPFDYSDPDGEQAAIAITKVPSKFDQGDERYRGPILLNPGGPGGSGVEFVLSAGPALQSLIGDDFDYLSFDPRGVGRTTPHVEIFSSRQESLILQSQLLGSANASSASLGTLYGGAQLIGNLTQDRAKRQAEHVSTPDVARDMLNIVKAHGMDKLQYWGFSYGSVLGVTFASMFPDNVGRVILDGVVDAENYYAALWDNNLLDADDALSWYYDDCVKAGPEICPIFEPTVSQIDQRVNNVLERLKVAPIPFVNTTDGALAVVGYDLVKGQLFQTVYFPHDIGAAFASAFAALEAGNPEEMWRLSGTGAAIEEFFDDFCSRETNGSTVAGFPSFTIACGDGAPVDETLDDLRDFEERMSEQSVFGDVWVTHIYCAAWKVQASNKYSGNFAANTSNPILFIGNTADPVTPLRSAHKMAQGFPGSVVLQQNSPGHCSFAASSVCTAKAVREYFRNNTLPQPGTVCEVESSSFENTANGTFLRTREFNEYDRMLLEASRALQRNHRRGGRMF